MSELDANSLEIWQKLDLHLREYRNAHFRFLREDIDRVAVIRYALKKVNRIAVLTVAPYLSEQERLDLFPEWLLLASFNNPDLFAARDLIVALPREWVLANIEKLADPLLENGTYDEYYRILELYRDLGATDLIEQLARRALAHSDFDVREAGETFLGLL